MTTDEQHTTDVRYLAWTNDTILQHMRTCTELHSQLVNLLVTRYKRIAQHLMDLERRLEHLETDGGKDAPRA